MESTGRQIGKAALWSMLAKTSRFVLGMASSIIVVRGLGRHDYGVLSLVRTFLMFMVIMAGAGMGQALLKYIPSLRVAGDVAGARRLLRRVVVIQTALWILLLVLCRFLEPYFGRLFDVEGIGRLFFLAMGLASIELYYSLLSQIFNACYDTKLLSISSVFSHVIYICSLFLLMPRYGVIGVVAAGAAGNLVSSLLLVSRIGVHFGEAAGRGSGDGIEGKRLIRFSLPFAVIGVLNMVVWRQSETFFLAHYHGAVVTGYFDLAYRLPQTMLEFIPGTVWPLVMAGVSEVYAKDPGRLKEAVEKYYKILFILCAPLSFYGIVLGGSLIHVLFGSDMDPASLPARVFFGIFMVSFFGTPLSMSLYVLEKSHANMLAYLIFTIVNVGLDIILIPRFAMVGAVIPVALVIIASPFVYRYILSRYAPEVRIPFGFIGRCFIAAAPVLLLMPLAPHVDSVLEFLLASSGAFVLALLGFRVMGILGSEERDMLTAVPLPMMSILLKFLIPGEGSKSRPGGH